MTALHFPLLLCSRQPAPSVLLSWQPTPFHLTDLESGYLIIMVKGNNGKAARRQLAKRIAVVLTTFGGILVVSTLLGFGGRRRGGGRILRKPLVSSSFPDRKLTKEEALDHVLAGNLHLMDIRTDLDDWIAARKRRNDYGGITAVFCRLDFDLHKNNPSKYPMFRDLISNSPDCNTNKYEFDLYNLMEDVRHYDAVHDNVVHALNLTAVAFHESRCGSTLVANTFLAANPTQHRVYSESAPPFATLRFLVHQCGPHYCPPAVQQQVIRDVFYLMGRSNDPQEKRFFFKFQSAMTYFLGDIANAFPDLPWLFIYREPVQVMMSHVRNGLKNAHCTRTRNNPPPKVTSLLDQQFGGTDTNNNIRLEDYCAAHLAGLVETAMDHLSLEPEDDQVDDPEDEADPSTMSRGIPVNYQDLPQKLYQHILPRLGVDLSAADIDRIQQVSSMYAKGRDGQARVFSSDNAEKEEAASDEVKMAADRFLKEPYEFMNAYKSFLDLEY